MCDFLPDAFFALKNADKYPNIHVTGAGLRQLNGIYYLFRCGDVLVTYTNGFCFLEKFAIAKRWFFYVGYKDNKSEKWNFISFYELKSDADYPPSTGWKAFNNKYLPAPTITSLKS